MYKNIDTFVQGFANGGGVGFERGRGSMYDSYPSAKKEKKKKKKEKSFSDGPGFAITGSGDFILKVVAKDIESYQKLMLEKVSEIESTDSLQSMVILSTFKDNKEMPL